MANQQQNPNKVSGTQSQSKKDNSQPRQQQGGDANQREDEDKSVGPDEAEREGRNPKPFTVS